MKKLLWARVDDLGRNIYIWVYIHWGHCGDGGQGGYGGLS